MSFRALALVPLLASGLLVTPAAAERLFVAGDSGRILVADTTDGVFVDFALAPCGFQFEALAADGRHLFATDASGLLNVFDLHDGSVQNVFAPNTGPVRALAAAHGSVFLGTQDGRVLRIHPELGDVLGERLLPAGVKALLADGKFLFAAGADGAIYRAPIDGGEFEYFTCFCFFDIQALALVGGDLIASDASGIVARIDLGTGSIVGAFSVGFTGSMAALDGHLLFYYDGGTIPFVDANSGESLGGSFSAPLTVEALLVTREAPSKRHLGGSRAPAGAPRKL